MTTKIELTDDVADALQKLVNHYDTRFARYEAREVALLTVVGTLIVHLKDQGVIGAPFVDALSLIEQQLKGMTDGRPDLHEEIDFVLGMCLVSAGVKSDPPTPPKHPTLTVIVGGKT